jgi:tRNA pseudouridine32 synthase
MALTTTTFDTNSFPLGNSLPELPPPPVVAITPCDPWPRPYYHEGGLRRVAPYHYTYNTFCKQRWRGREILDVFTAEFRDRTREYYKNAIETGQITINGKACVDIHTIVNNGDVVSHTLHRHEPPVTAQPIRVISETDSMIVIDKPAGVPVHPAGRYKYNSVVEIIRAERHFSFNPLPCNRLDRLTSGVMFIGKTSQEAEVISRKLRGRTIRKEYVARVKGRFPDGHGGDGDPMRGGVVKCEESILQISPILGLNRARASGKSAKTLFRRLAYYPQGEKSTKTSTPIPTVITTDPASAEPLEVATPPPPPETEDGGYSIVHCLPLTGRTHQIRVHLQFLGHPISNDPIYSNRRVFGPELARSDASGDNDAAIIERLSKMGKTELADAASYDLDKVVAQMSLSVNQTQQTTLSDLQNFKPLSAGTLHAGNIPAEESDNHSSLSHTSKNYDQFVKQHDEMVADYNKRKGEKMTGEKCKICDTPLYSDPGPQELGIYLHALAYGDLLGEWTYRSEMPSWGLPPPGKNGPKEVGEWPYDGTETLDGLDEEEAARAANRRGIEKNKVDNVVSGEGR